MPGVTDEQRVNEAYEDALARIDWLAEKAGQPDWPLWISRQIRLAGRIDDGEANGVAYTACLLLHHGGMLRRTMPDLARLFSATGHALLTYWATLTGHAGNLADLEARRWRYDEGAPPHADE